MSLKRCVNYRFLVFFVSFVVFISCTLPCFTRKAYAFVGVDDAVVAAALAAAAGITFVVSDDSTRQALDDFVQQFNYSDFIHDVASSVYKTSDNKFIYPIAAVYAGTVKNFATDLYKHFCDVGKSGSVAVSVSSDVAFNYASAGDVGPYAFHADKDYYKIYLHSRSEPVKMTFSVASGSFTSYFNGVKFNSGYIDIDHFYFATLSGGIAVRICNSTGSSSGYYPTVDVLRSVLHDSSITADDVYFISYDDSKYYVNDKSSAYTVAPTAPTTDKNVDYNNTVSKGMTADDAANALSEKVAAGNCAVNAGTDNAVDSTQTYTQAQENLLTTTDVVKPVTDTNTGITSILGLLQAILAKILAIPVALCNALLALLKALFLPTDTVLNNGFNKCLVGLQKKMDSNTYQNFFTQIQSLQAADLKDLTLNVFGTDYVVVTWRFFRENKHVIQEWIRGFMFILLLLYNINWLYKILRAVGFLDGSGSHDSSSKGHYGTNLKKG